MSDDGLPGNPREPEDVRRIADDILSGSEYAVPEASVVERVFGWIGDRLGNLFDAVAGGGPGSVIGWLTVAAAVAGAAWLLLRAFRLPAAPTVRTGVVPQHGTEGRRDPGVWLAEADRLHAAGDDRGALRCRHQAHVGRLIDAGVLDDAPGQTTGDHRSIASAALPELAPVVDRLTDAFEQAWYGGAPVSGDQYRSFVADAQRVESAAGRGVGATR